MQTSFSFEELSTMPMQCYGCGLPLRHLLIIESLTSGKSLRQTMDELNYRRICCRKSIQLPPSIVSLQKRLAMDTQIAQSLSRLTLESTSATGVPNGGLQIVDQVPPGMEPGGLCFPDETEIYPDDTDINPFEYFMSQLEAVDDEDS